MPKKKQASSLLKKIAEQVHSTTNIIENATLSPFATKSSEAFRLKKEKQDALRTPFERDRHRVIFSDSYRGYRGRTQVFLLANYHIADRMVHVNYVAQISRMLAKALKLNMDLAEAIAVTHDLGHAPYGHDGEKILSDISQEYKIGEFHHNIHSVRVVDVLEKNGKGLNLTFQVRDGAFSHDGEVHNLKLIPERKKTESKLQSDIAKLSQGKKVRSMPSTLEGCAMRISDTIAYIGSDIEDSVKLKLIKISDLPKVCLEKLGRTNGQIIDSIIADIIQNSYDHDYISFSDEISEVVKILKEWNYKNIYLKFEERRSSFFHQWQYQRKKVRDGMFKMFETFYNDLIHKNYESLIYREFVNKMSSNYINDKNNTPAIITRDYITTMTDEYATRVLEDILIPKPLFQVIEWKKK